MKRVLSLGAGVQSSTLLLMSARGLLPHLDAAIFADTQYEPPAVYTHLAWLEGVAAKAGIPCHRVTVGNIREDALEFRQHRRSSDGKRYASIPLFVNNPDGKQGRLPRQCTSEYKIEPVERFVRREILGLKPRQQAPKEVVVEQWMGITTDEGRRAKPPGRWREKDAGSQGNLFGEAEQLKRKEWEPIPWKVHAYPFMNLILQPDRRSRHQDFLPDTMDRDACLHWLKEHYPDREVPRSACVCCPFRTNAEWQRMKDEDPESWQDAVAFDKEVRLRPEAGLTDGRKQKIRKPLVGTIYVHRQMVPLDMADLTLTDKRDPADCGTLFDQGCEGMCGM
jgi:hypothetical protein